MTPNDIRHRFAKGVLYILGGNIVLNLSGYIIHFGLVRIITPELYGSLGVVLSLLTVIQIFLMIFSLLFLKLNLIMKF